MQSDVRYSKGRRRLWAPRLLDRESQIFLADRGRLSTQSETSQNTRTQSCPARASRPTYSTSLHPGSAASPVRSQALHSCCPTSSSSIPFRQRRSRVRRSPSRQLKLVRVRSDSTGARSAMHTTWHTSDFSASSNPLLTVSRVPFACTGSTRLFPL